MAVTDELRGWACDHMAFTFETTPNGEHMLASGTVEALIAIADRIDMEHERGIVGACIEGMSIDDSELETRGLMRIPVDADGEVVRVGGCVRIHPFDGPSRKVKALHLSGFGWQVILEDGSKEPLYRVRACKPPTTEDVLREFAERVCNSGHQWGLDADATIAEYAKRLQLRGEDA